MRSGFTFLFPWLFLFVSWSTELASASVLQGWMNTRVIGLDEKVKKLAMPNGLWHKMHLVSIQAVGHLRRL